MVHVSSGVIDFDYSRTARWRGYGHAFLAHALQMKLDRLMNKPLHFVSGVAN
jgi:hypothetical protein